MRGIGRKIVSIGFGLIATGCVALGSGGRRLVRSLNIHQHHFDPKELTVPENTPFDLEVSALDTADMAISSPALGFASVTVPATWRNEYSVKQFSTADLREVRISIAGLRKGRLRD